MPYKITDTHTCADVGLIVSGETLEQLFADSAAGLMAIMVEPDGVRENKNSTLELEADDLEELFYSWLSELIYIKDADDFLLKECKLKITKNNQYKLKAELTGDSIDPKRQTLKTDVKGVTYYRFRIEKIENEWHGEVVFDL
jgi:SHS2 domain-containing protein